MQALRKLVKQVHITKIFNVFDDEKIYHIKAWSEDDDGQGLKNQYYGEYNFIP